MYGVLSGRRHGPERRQTATAFMQSRWGFSSDLATTDDIYILNLSALKDRAFNLKMHCAVEPALRKAN
jgi:hypothetical protein